MDRSARSVQSAAIEIRIDVGASPGGPSTEAVAPDPADRFPPNISDVGWMQELDREGGWAVLTKDLRIQFRPHERLALDRLKIVFFFLGGAWRKYSVPETAARLIRLVPLMAMQVDIADRGRFDLPINAGSKLRPHRD
jgi:hypothetical protein